MTEGSQFTCDPNTHVAAFSRSMMSNAATQNASAVPATIRMNAILNSCRDVKEVNGTPQPSRHKKNSRKPRFRHLRFNVRVH